jgi:phage shock protein A
VEHEQNLKEQLENQLDTLQSENEGLRQIVRTMREEMEQAEMQHQQLDTQGQHGKVVEDVSLLLGKLEDLSLKYVFFDMSTYLTTD